MANKPHTRPARHNAKPATPAEAVPTTPTQLLRKEIESFAGEAFTAQDVKEIPNYSRALDNLVAIGEVMITKDVTLDGKKIFKATRSFQKWNNVVRHRLQRIEYHKDLKPSCVLHNDIDELPGWRDVLPVLFADPYFSLK